MIRSLSHLNSLALMLAAALALTIGCERTPPPQPGPPSSASPTQGRAPEPVEPLRRLPVPARLLAIGDLHGDLDAAVAALRLGSAIDAQSHWIGDKLVVVQTGDQLDRADAERGVLDLFDRISREARAVGGAVIELNGNHEVMNVQLNFDYVTEGGFRDFRNVPGLDLTAPAVVRLPEPQRARAAALMPGGPVAKQLATRDTIALVGDTLLVHGGVLPKHVRYGLERINREVRAWMNAEQAEAPKIVVSQDGPIWTRKYSAAADREDCTVLKEVLDAVGAKRMVVGHTVQRGGISSACDQRVWRIDVGLSRAYGGDTEVLEIEGEAVRPLRRPRAAKQ
jgi:hypothetical protein